MSDSKDPVQAMVDAMLESEKEVTPTEVTDEVAEEKAETTEEQTEESDKETEESPEETEESQDENDTVSKSQYEKEIKGKVKLRAKLREAKEEAAKLKAELESLKKPKEPSFDDYENVEDYEVALEKYEKERKEVSPPQELNIARETLIEQHDDWSEAPSDWYDVVSKDPKDGGVPFNAEMLAMLADLPNGAEVMYSLAQDREAFDGIVSKLSPVMRARQLERYADSLKPAPSNNAMQGKQPHKPTVKAIDPVGGGTRSTPKLETMDVGDHIKLVQSRGRF